MQTSPKPSWLGFSLRDLVYLALFAALSFVLMAFTSPLHAVRVFGIQTLATGPFLSFFAMLALILVGKPGSLLIMSVISSATTLSVHPTSFIYSIFAAAVAELVALLIARSYQKRSARYIASVLRPLAQLPVQLIYTALIMGRGLSAIRGSLPLILAVLAGAVVLSLAGAFLAEKIALELQKSGRLSK